jgi:hypothetical protein
LSTYILLNVINGMDFLAPVVVPDQKVEIPQVATASTTVRSPPSQQHPQADSGPNSCPQDMTATTSPIVTTETTLTNVGEASQGPKTDTTMLLDSHHQ